VAAGSLQKTAAAAEAWLAHYPEAKFTDIRFDALLGAPGRLPQQIPAAFMAEG